MFNSREDRIALQKYLSHGKLDYQKLFQEDWLENAYSWIINHNLEFQDEKERFTFWINAYNILTLESVKIERDRNPNWKGNTTWYSKLRFFVFRKFTIGNKKVSLYTLENKILRKEFKDPRMHFVINCAATSCPFIPNSLLSADQLEEMLEQYTSSFINDQQGVIIKDDTIYLSRIFEWYKKDFPNGVMEFIRKYWKGNTIPSNLNVKYQDYDWSLNFMKP